MKARKVGAALLIAAVVGALASAGSSAMAGTPVADPQGGPFFGKLDPEAHYYVKIDNTGDGVEDVSYRWDFKNRFRIPSSSLYAPPPIDSLDMVTGPNEAVEVNTVPNPQWHDAIFT